MRTNKDLTDIIAESFCCSKAEARRALHRVRERIFAEMTESGDFLFPLVGKLYTQVRAEHEAWNPKTREKIVAPTRLKTAFCAGLRAQNFSAKKSQKKFATPMGMGYIAHRTSTA